MPMRNKLATLIVACGVAVLPLDGQSLGCDKDKIVRCGSAQPVVAKVDKTTAPKAAVIAACCPSAGKARVAAQVVEVDLPAGSADERTIKLLAGALESMQGCCGVDCAARVKVVAALQTLAEANPGSVCSKKLAALTGTRTCGSAKTVAVAAGSATSSQCRAAKAAARAVAATAAAEPSSACRAAKAKAKAPARYVAFGCKKTDRLARAVARAYLDLMSELKTSAGADGCSVKAASEVLASVIDEMRAEREAKATAETTADVETAPVSLGVVSDKGRTSRRTCGSK